MINNIFKESNRWHQKKTINNVKTQHSIINKNNIFKTLFAIVGTYAKYDKMFLSSFVSCRYKEDVLLHINKIV